MGNPDAFTSRVFVNAIRTHSMGLWRDRICTEHRTSDGIIIHTVYPPIASCGNADRQDEQETPDAVIRHSRSHMHTHDTLCVALRESGVVASISCERYNRDGTDIPATGKTGTAQTFQQPASEVATTLVTPEDKYQKAGSLNALAYSVINMASPVIATALYSAGGLTLVIIVDLSTFTVAFLSLLLFVKIPEVKSEKREDSHIMMDLKESLCFLKVNTGILQVILFLAAINFIASIYNAALPAMILSFESESTLAAVQSTAGIAMITGSVIAAMMPAPKSRVKMIIISLFISMSTENFMLSFSRNPVIWCLGAFLGWLCIPVMNTNLDALMRSSIPSGIQGRVYSARNMLQFFTIPLGYLAGGFLVDTVFEPFMADKSDTVLNQLFGTGKGSGAAFLFAVIGVSGVLVCIVFSRLENMRKLE